jgi:hypothetical protein
MLLTPTPAKSLRLRVSAVKQFCELNAGPRNRECIIPLFPLKPILA